MRGPGLDLTNLVYAYHDIGFRVIKDYHVGTDGYLIRIDVKIDDKQYGVTLLASQPQIPLAGSKFNSTDDMLKPKIRDLECINTKVTKSELVKALKELIHDIETDTKEKENE